MGLFWRMRLFCDERIVSNFASNHEFGGGGGIFVT